jgi:phospholipid/cholesterol/gamma-HCH transport system substrate-binding protein
LKITREAKAAILVIGAILVFIWGYSFLKGRDLFNSYKTLYVVYENVEGLSPSAPVTINGLVIGKVSSITPAEKGHLLVAMQIGNNEFPISKTSKAALYEPSIVGGKQIAIKPDFANTSITEDGDYLDSSVEPGMLSTISQELKPLQDKVETTVVSADSLMTKLNNVLDSKTQANLRNSIADLSKTMKEFSQTTKSINGMLADNKTNINGTLDNMNKTTANLAQITDSLNSANLAETVRKLENTMANVDNILSDLEAGKGTMGKLLKDEAMYDNLNGASKELKELLADLKNNPKRYMHFSVFGKKNTPYVKKE